jgi:hypothetical protein
MKMVLAVVLVMLAGCADYGVSRYSVEPVILKDGTPVCCKVSRVNGKEIGYIRAKVEKRGDAWLIDLEESDVSAFQGQRIATDAVTTGVGTAVDAATAIIAPASVIPGLLQ